MNSNVRHLASYVLRHKKNLVVVFSSLFLVACSILAIGVVFRRLVDSGLSAEHMEQVNNSIYMILLLISCFSVGSFFRSYFINVIATKVTSELKADSYRDLLKIDFVKFEELKIGDILSRLGADIEVINNLIINFLSFFVRNSIMLTGAMILMFIQSPKLSILVLVSVPLLLMPILKLSKRVRKLSKSVLEEQASIAANIEESMSGVRTLYAYNQQDFSGKNFSAKMENYVQASSNRFKYRSLFFALAILVIAGSITSVIWVGSVDIIQGSMSSGQMISFIYYAIIVGTSAGGVAEMFSEMQAPLAALDRVLELKKTYQVSSENKLLKFKGDDYEIKFEDVVFSYPARPDLCVLNKISFSLKQGKFSAIVGRSGSGKTSLMQILLKFYNYQSGKISVGKNDLLLVDPYSLRKKIAYVEQYPMIFSGTIRSNIAFSNPKASAKEIENIAKVCGILDFAKKLKQGLDAEIGEKGVRISGGQKQRIAIARALLYKPEILLLDEATSALDSESEAKILNNIRKLLKGKTIVSIAHRISSIENADEIIVINEGRVASVGNHTSLMRSSKIYNLLYKDQDI